MQMYLEMRLTVLLELLAEHTKNYTQMLTNGYDNYRDLKESETILRFLQQEIESRNQNATSVSETEIDFKQQDQWSQYILIQAWFFFILVCPS